MFLHKNACNLLQSDISKSWFEAGEKQKLYNKEIAIFFDMLFCWLVLKPCWFEKEIIITTLLHFFGLKAHTLFSHFWSENHTHKIESIRIALFTKYSENWNFLFCFLHSVSSFASSSGVGPPWSRIGDSNFLYYWFSGSNFNIANLALHDLALGTLE